MRSMGSIVGLLMVAAIALLAYKFYFSQSRSSGTATPMKTINVVGVKNDLVAIAQAERAYQVEHSSYASMDELVSSGAMNMAKRGRDGYTYEIETSSEGFHVVAHCPVVTNPGCSNYAIDQNMEVQPVP
jgi:hypothetical protein